MDNKKIKNILVITISIVLFFSLVVFFFNKSKQVVPIATSPQEISQNNKDRIDTQKIKTETEDTGLSVRGRIKSFDEKIITFTTSDGKELELKIPQTNIPQEAIVFMKKNNNEILNNFKLENISKDREVDILYMTLSRYLVQITVE